MPKALIFGGTGQIGSAIADKLLQSAWAVTIPSRRKDLSQTATRNVIPFSLRDESLKTAMRDADAVINCIGILAPKGGDTFDSLHAELPQRLAQFAASHGIKHFIHLSAIGADAQSPSTYARSKAVGEAAIAGAFPAAIILRPSIVFGPRDSFFNRFAAMARLSPFLPLIGGGQSRFQPVYVGDIAETVSRLLAKAPHEEIEKTFFLGGPATYSFKELMEFILRTTGMKRLLLPIPWALAELQAAILEKLPGKILTRDQLKLLRNDNIVPRGSNGLEALGITPQSIETIVPTYLK